LFALLFGWLGLCHDKRRRPRDQRERQRKCEKPPHNLLLPIVPPASASLAIVVSRAPPPTRRYPAVFPPPTPARRCDRPARPLARAWPISETCRRRRLHRQNCLRSRAAPRPSH